MLALGYLWYSEHAVRANFTMSPSGTTPVFSIDAASQGTSLCAANVGGFNTQCPAQVPINPAGVPLFVAANPGAVSIPAGCAGATQTNTLTKSINNSGSATNLLLVAGAGAELVHICGINIGPVGSTSINVALVEGTTTTNPCDTGTVGMAGGATAATGWQIPAGGGLTYGNGMGVVARTATAADNVCLFFSAGVQISGVITYAVF
jgi:hypothetical protein